ncbi:probable methyltransferase At1g29790 [Musa acuminata AAA Group]|uniref:probable methyltransferase At1g29790 n=1 Tax=Musa acuminata AAA Group TaxID=214697 RepID=UPI0031D9F5ED
MGSVSLNIRDGTARFRRATLCSSAVHLLMLASVLTTNLFALYAFTSAPSPSAVPAFFRHHPGVGGGRGNVSVISDHVSLIVREIEASERRLHMIERELAGYDTLDTSKSSLPSELKLFLAHHPLPLGRDARSGITDMVASVADSCARSPAAELLSRYMSYRPAAPCPTDDFLLPQKLVAKACEPLPRRRCLSRPAASSAAIPRLSFAQSLWNPGAKIPGAGIYGIDKQMWVKPRSKNDFLIDDVLALCSGGIRIGFDIGGGAANFAARMAERNVTVVTSTLEIGGKPMNEFVAARGLFPLLLSPAQRFPFYDSVFDLVHAINALDEGGAPSLGQASRTEALEFFMFDIDRVLRAGGVFWLDNDLCTDDDRKRTVTRLLERLGYKKLKWVVGEKADASSSGKTQIRLSAVLQKPARSRTASHSPENS